MPTQLNFFKGEDVKEEFKIKRADLIEQLAEYMADNMRLDDLAQYFRENQETWLGSLTDRELQEQYVEIWNEEAPIIEG